MTIAKLWLSGTFGGVGSGHELESPGQAIRVIIHDSDGGIGHYSRDQDDDGRAIWREGRPTS